MSAVFKMDTWKKEAEKQRPKTTWWSKDGGSSETWGYAGWRSSNEVRVTANDMQGRPAKMWDCVPPTYCMHVARTGCAERVQTYLPQFYKAHLLTTLTKQRTVSIVTVAIYGVSDTVSACVFSLKRCRVLCIHALKLSERSHLDQARKVVPQLAIATKAN